MDSQLLERIGERFAKELPKISMVDSCWKIVTEEFSKDATGRALSKNYLFKAKTDLREHRDWDSICKSCGKSHCTCYEDN